MGWREIENINKISYRRQSNPMLGSIKHSLHTIQFTVNTTKDAGKKEKKLKQKRNEISPQIIYIINIIHHTLLDPTQITIKKQKNK